MRYLSRSCIASLSLLLPLSLGAQTIAPQANAIGAAPIECASGKPINEEGFVKIGGIEQWVTIKGDDCKNPVILFVHGGPGNPMTPYVNSPYRPWEKEFTFVHWDQRGAGQTYGRNPIEPETEEHILSVEGLATDGVEVAAFATKHLNARKLILFGGSWGSVLGVHMAKRRPDLFVAYVGTGQLVGPDNDKESYRKTLELARASGDKKTVEMLEGFGMPPWTKPRTPGLLRRISRIYEAKTTDPAPPSWWSRSPQYSNDEALINYGKGEDFSWLQYVGMKGDGMRYSVDLPRLGSDFQIPVFIIMGAEDLTSVPEVAKRYFDSISAPQKEYFLLPRTGHDHNHIMLEAQHKVLTTKVRPLLR
ncbi:alpha/beta fold hydrolase [Pseudoduganella violacea]|uniref:Proline iminopeptidase n=1 Tax=Pseudoduganella violacea TaxID=1715466 RepID=A0A7W5BDL6_9BURK|nr:alpha/beta hydrolase [Pseudoduganella violacea]MBB3120940.1 pimeloyl-ACP methyl ester carboxylesterase [Pseudoduganella violacea]